jgi:AcrR family transcriptional regulator
MKPTQKSEKKRRILKAAITLFSKTHDIQKVSLEDIAREAAVSPATIYNHFGTRENLVREVSRELVGELLRKTRALIDSDVPFPQKLSELFSFKMDFIDKNREMLVKLLSQYESIVSETINLNEIKDLSNEFFDSAKKQGYIDESFDSQTLAEYFDVLRAGIAAKPVLASRFGENPRLVADFSRLIFYGVMKKDVGLFNP